jgi:hypothetical protein
MRYSKDKLYSLLPAIYRLHDAKLGQPLEALVSIVAEEVSIIENDIEDLYDNWFIETCNEWVVPYIGDSLAAKIFFQPKTATITITTTHTSSTSKSAAIISPRAWVANTLGYRRRKGTVAVLEQIAKDITGWNAKAVEFFKLISVSQNINHLLLKNQLVDVRNASDLILVRTPFENSPHTIDIRSIKSETGFHNIPNIGVFLWRIQAYPVTNSPAFDHGDGKYSFNQLGIDAPLFNHPITEGDISHLAEEFNLPIILTRSILRENFDMYYGIGKSISVEMDGSPMPASDFAVENLADWTRPPPDKAALIDPILGRITFQSDKIPAIIRVSYYYGFSSDIGGGFYDRGEKYYNNIIPSNIRTYRISKKLIDAEILNSLSDAINMWSNDGKPSAILEILDSEFYEQESIDLSLPSGCLLIIRSAENQRPVLRAAQVKNHRKEKYNQKQQQQQPQQEQKVIEISGDRDSSLIFDGLWIDANLGITVKPGQLGLLQFTHCTLVPDNGSTSIAVGESNDELNVIIYRSICGKIYASLRSETRFDIIDSIVDSKSDIVKENYDGSYNRYISTDSGNSGGNTNRYRAEHGQKTQIKYDDYDNSNSSNSNAILCFKINIKGSTIFGKVNVNSISASNTIFTNRVTARRRQEGCIRFSYVPRGSITPRRYRCQPENDIINTNRYKPSSIIIYPKFTSVNYGDPAYAQLHKSVDIKIFEGADNESEMGVFNNLYQPERIKNFKSALDEYLRFGMEAGTILIDLGRQNYEGRYH